MIHMKQETAWYLIKVLAIIGLVLASYLLYNYIFQPTFQLCYVNSTVNCDAVIKGEVSTTLGIPTALYGFVGYIAIFTAAMLKRKNWLLGIATFGMLFCLRITYIELVILKVICPVCVTCQLVMASIFGLATYLKVKKSD